jgi:hypothetical protein
MTFLTWPGDRRWLYFHCRANFRFAAAAMTTGQWHPHG